MISGKFIMVGRTGRVTLDVERVKKALPPIIIGMIQRRVQQGQDIYGKPFAQYSQMWREQLHAMGESDKVDLRLTGGMMNSVRLLRTERAGKTGIALVFGPDAGTSAQVAPPSKEKQANNERAQQRETAKTGVAQNRGSAKRTGARGPAQILLGLWLHKGGRSRPARPWLGLSPTQRKEVSQYLQRIGVWKS